MKNAFSSTPHTISTVGSRSVDQRSLFKHLGLAAIVMTAMATAACTPGTRAEANQVKEQTAHSSSDASQQEQSYVDERGRNFGMAHGAPAGSTVIACYLSNGTRMVTDIAKGHVNYQSGGFYEYTSKISGDEMQVPTNSCYVIKKASRP